MEHVFADLPARSDTACLESDKALKSKRKAFIFMTIEPDLRKAAFEDLQSVEGVNEVYFSRGVYDIIAKVSGESLEHLNDVVVKKIKSLTSIRSTLTLTVI